MKKFYTIFLFVSFFLLSISSVQAQGIHQFWGITDYGGTNDEGVLFSAKSDGTGVTPRKAFEIYTPGAHNLGQDMIEYNGKLYGMMPEGGPRGRGIVFEYDPATGKYTKRANLSDVVGSIDLHSSPVGKLVVYNNLLYGIAGVYTGTDDAGVLFSFNPATGALVKKHEFTDATGSYPGAGLTLYNNKLYGTTPYGGGNGKGVLFSFNPATDAYTVLAGFDDNVGKTSYDNLLVYNNRLYGTTIEGSLNNGGSIFEFNPANNQLVKKVNLNDIGTLFATGLTLFNNKFYGGTYDGGATGGGMIYEYNPALNTITKKLDLTNANGIQIMAPLTVYNNKLYGLTNNGGNSNDGVLFEYDVATNVYTKKVNFSNAMGRSPYGGLVLCNERLYGITSYGGGFDLGVLFEYNPSFNGYMKKVEFGASNAYRPNGRLTYYSGKLYGTTTYGGDHNKGVIYSYDIATHTFTIRHHMESATGNTSDQGGMLLYNNKLYGVTYYGGNENGVLYEFDPLNDNYTVKHHFTEASGISPTGVPVLYNGKLYGTTRNGGNTGTGVLYEYDPASGTYTVKVHLSNAFGKNPQAALTVYNGKLYGTTTTGGANDRGTLFEYDPSFNGFAVRYHFALATGYQPSSALVVYNNLLWGTTDYGGQQDASGTIYSFNPATFAYTRKYDLLYPNEQQSRTDLIVYNNKLYGMSNVGGTERFGGTLYEYDPATDVFTNKTDFTNYNGRLPRYSRLTVLPALVAPGLAGVCLNANTVQVDNNNKSTWIPFTDAEGNAVAEINANGNNLGQVTVRYYTHNGATRQDAQGRFYLNRNLNITVTHQPVTPVSIRLYIRKTEFDALKNTAGTGIATVSDITVFKNEDNCSGSIKGSALPLTSSVTGWGLDYVYTAEVSSFSSFYFASKAYTALPVKLESFTGSVEPSVNLLQWKASCTGDVDFIVERSSNGIDYKEVGLVLATEGDCARPFQFSDQHPLPGKQYYRLRMKETNGATTLSAAIVLNRHETGSLSITPTPNPVTGSQAVFAISSPANKNLSVSIYDITGRVVLHTQWQVQKGVQSRTVGVQQLAAGTYQAVISDGESTQLVRFMRQ